MENETLINDVDSQLLAEAKKALRANDFDVAKAKFNEVLSIDPDNIEARFGILNTNTKTRNMDELLEYYENLYSSPAYESIKACEPDVSRIEKNVEKFYIPGYLEKDEIRSICKYNNFEYQSCLKQRQKQRQQIEDEIRKDEDLSFLYNHKDNEISSSFFNRLKAAYDRRINDAQIEDDDNYYQYNEAYNQFLDSVENQLVNLHQRRLNSKDYEDDYKELVEKFNDEYLSAGELEYLITEFSKYKDYEDSAYYLKECHRRLIDLNKSQLFRKQTDESLIKKAENSLNEYDFDEARKLYRKLVKRDENNIEAKLGLFMAENGLASLNELFDYYKNKYNYTEQDTISVDTGDVGHVSRMISKYHVEGYLDDKTIRDLYECDLTYQSNYNARLRQLQQILDEIETSEVFEWLRESKEKEALRSIEELINVYEKRVEVERKENEKQEKKKLSRYKRFLKKTDEKVIELYEKALQEKKRNVLGNRKVEKKETVIEDDYDEYDDYDYDDEDEDDEDLEEEHEEIIDEEVVFEEKSKQFFAQEYTKLQDQEVKESKEVVEGNVVPLKEEAPVEEPKEEVVEDVIEEKSAQETQEEEVETIVEEIPVEIEEEEVFDDYKEDKYVGKHKFSVVFIVLGIMLLGVLGTVGYYYVYVPMTNYNKAIEKMNNKNYDEAISMFKNLDNYRNSKEMASEAMYKKADDLYKNKQYVDAANLFKQISYSDSQSRVQEIKEQLFSDVKIGSTILYGMYEQDGNGENGREFIEWEVIAIEDDRMLVISKYGLDVQKYNNTSDIAFWETCSLRGWLNGRFAGNAFIGEDPSRVLETELSNIRYLEDGETEEYTTNDRLFVLSSAEIEDYLPYEINRICIATNNILERIAHNDGKCIWWLRTPIGYDTATESSIDANGSLGFSMFEISNAVRPSIWMAME